MKSRNIVPGAFFYIFAKYYYYALLTLDLCMRQHTLFIADLHLDERHPHSHLCFINFVKHYANGCDAIYILGDFFEYWIGDDAATPFQQRIIFELKQLTQQGLPIYFMRGNRDFLIGKRFARMTGCKIINDPSRVEVYGHAVLLTHGDSLCTLDHRHLRFRKLSHKPYLQKMFTILPVSFRQFIAKKMRKTSRKHVSELQPQVMDVTESAVIASMTRHNTNYLIHGHTHRPEIHQVRLPAPPANPIYGERIVLGAWHTQGNALKWYADGEKELFWFQEDVQSQPGPVQIS